MGPIPNYLAHNQILDSGEALTYATMMQTNALPHNAGLDFLHYTSLIAFSNPPYSLSFFQKKIRSKKNKVTSRFGKLECF